MITSDKILEPGKFKIYKFQIYEFKIYKFKRGPVPEPMRAGAQNTGPSDWLI